MKEKIKNNIDWVGQLISKVLSIGLLILFIYFIVFGISWLWENGKRNTMNKIVCENYFCEYNPSEKIWNFQGQYFDTNKECAKYCVGYTVDNNIRVIYDISSQEQTLISETLEYKRTWYYKVDNYFK